jgi:methionyl-tRNA formyltransferase
MRILFMGTPDFASVTLAKLIESKHELIGVVTQPDRQKGRGNTVSLSAVKELALKHELTIYQPVKAKDPEFIELVKTLAPEAIVVAAFGQILPKALLDIPPYGCINIHGSLLPKYRGAAPIQYSILDGEKETGITIMYMDAGIDTGDIILQSSIPIAPEETGGSLFNKMAVLGADLLLEALGQLEAGTANRIPQDNEKANYVKILDKDMGRLDFTQSAEKLERYIRGLNPWPSAYTTLDGKTLKLWQAKVEAGSLSDQKAPGEIIELRKDSFTVATGDGVLVVKEVQLEGKKRMMVDAFLRGYSIVVGTRLI